MTFDYMRWGLPAFFINARLLGAHTARRRMANCLHVFARRAGFAKRRLMIFDYSDAMYTHAVIRD